MQARSAITVNAPAETVYRRWRELDPFPTTEWEADVNEDVPGERIGWRSREGASVEHRGTVAFRPAPGGRGTEVHAEIGYEPQGGAVGSIVAKLFGEEPSQLLSDGLRHFKQLVETGEIARS